MRGCCEVDPTAPISPSNVLQWHYPVGHEHGTSVGVFYRFVPDNKSEFYVAFSVWHNPGFEWNPISNKLFYFEPGHIILSSRHNDHYLCVIVEGDPAVPDYQANVRQLSASDFEGKWVNIEILFKRGNPGVLKIWANGQLVMDRAVNIPTDTVGQWLQLDSTWGGTSNPTTRDSYRRVDHILVATTP